MHLNILVNKTYFHIFFNRMMSQIREKQNKGSNYLHQKKLVFNGMMKQMPNLVHQSIYILDKKQSITQENQKLLKGKEKKGKNHRYQILKLLQQIKLSFEKQNMRFKLQYDGRKKIYKYFSKNKYKYFLNENQKKLPLKQDQRKSIQSNLIYNVLKYLKWQNLEKYFFHNPSKKKILKINTFKQSILQGRCFQTLQNSQQYNITLRMLNKALQNLQRTEKLYEYLFLKAKYIKIYEEWPQIFSTRMLFSIYKLSQIVEIIKQQIDERENKSYQSTFLYQQKVPQQQNIDGPTQNSFNQQLVEYKYNQFSSKNHLDYNKNKIVIQTKQNQDFILNNKMNMDLYIMFYNQIQI